MSENLIEEHPIASILFFLILVGMAVLTVKLFFLEYEYNQLEEDYCGISDIDPITYDRPVGDDYLPSPISPGNFYVMISDGKTYLFENKSDRRAYKRASQIDFCRRYME